MTTTMTANLTDSLRRTRWILYNYGLDAALVLPQLLIRGTGQGRQKFFQTESLAWVAQIEAAYPEIVAEYKSISHTALPAYQEMEQINIEINRDDQWKTYFLHYYGYEPNRARRECPRTLAAIARIPGLQFAMFSILSPGKHVLAHRGPYAGVLRYHLGIDVPNGCEIRIEDERRSWSDGTSLLFDDSYEHEVWNRSALPRCVLFVDVERPLPWPLSRLNRWLLAQTAKTQFARDTLRNLRAWDSSA